ncbi:MAG: type II toxin-antitoxin system VapC family toxin [Stagnimonas sp.]|nr:type II toxin-antitoxin system VapC family toxin [Stagnimonas sp.]
MSLYLLDTSICISALRDPKSALAKRLGKMAVGEAVISSIVLAELELGIGLSSKKADNRRALQAFLQYFPVLDWPAQAATLYGEVRAELQQAGNEIGAMDLLIAVHALSLKATVITDNEKDFRRVRKLKVENWLRAAA